MLEWIWTLPWFLLPVATDGCLLWHVLVSGCWWLPPVRRRHIFRFLSWISNGLIVDGACLSSDPVFLPDSGLVAARSVSCGACAPHDLLCAIIYCRISLSCGNRYAYRAEEKLCDLRFLSWDLELLPHVCNTAGPDCRKRFMCGHFLPQVNLLWCPAVTLLVSCGIS